MFRSSMMEACGWRSLLRFAGALLIGYLLQSAVFVAVAVSDQTTSLTITNTSNSTISYTSISDMTEKQQDSAITIEFRPNVTSGGNVTALSEDELDRLHQVILDELNRQRRRRRRRRRTTATTETTAATVETVTATTETTAATTLTTATTTDLATTTVEETTTAPLTTDARTTTKNTEDATADTGPIIYLLRRRRRDIDLDFDDYLDIGDQDQSAEAGVWDSQFWADTAELGPPRARREAATLDPSDYYYYDYDSDYYTEDDLDFILIEPVVVDGVVRVAVALDKPGETDVDADLLQSAAEAVRDSGQLESEVGMHVERIYRGLPQDPTAAPVAVSSAAWLDWRFLVAFFVIFVCFFIIVMVIMCIRRRRQPTVKAVDEDTLLPASAPVHQQQRPADKPNDASTPIINGRTHAPAGYHDDDGYIVPYDIMLDVFAHSYDGPQGPCESTKL